MNRSVGFRDSNTFFLSRTDGAAFDFYSIDFSPQQPGFTFNGEVTFYSQAGFLGQGRAITSSEVRLTTFVFDEHNVTSVKVRSIWERGQFDNIVLNQAPAAAVPEPETYAMLLAGLGLLGWHARRRKQIAA